MKSNEKMWYNLRQTAVDQPSQRDCKLQKIQRTASRSKGMAIHKRWRRFGLLSSEKNNGDRIKVHEVMSGTD